MNGLKDIVTGVFSGIGERFGFGGEDELTQAQIEEQRIRAEGQAAFDAADVEGKAAATRQLALLKSGAVEEKTNFFGYGTGEFTRDVDGDGKIGKNEIFETMQAALEAATPTDGRLVNEKSAEQNSGAGGAPVAVAVENKVDQSQTVSQSSKTTVAVPPSSNQNNPRRDVW
jgi:hypothetical protein